MIPDLEAIHALRQQYFPRTVWEEPAISHHSAHEHPRMRLWSFKPLVKGSPRGFAIRGLLAAMASAPGGSEP